MADGMPLPRKRGIPEEENFFQLNYSINASVVYSFFPHVRDFFFAGWKNVVRPPDMHVAWAGRWWRVPGKTKKRGAVQNKQEVTGEDVQE